MATIPHNQPALSYTTNSKSPPREYSSNMCSAYWPIRFVLALARLASSDLRVVTLRGISLAAEGHGRGFDELLDEVSLLEPSNFPGWYTCDVARNEPLGLHVCIRTGRCTCIRASKYVHMHAYVHRRNPDRQPD